MCGFTGVISRDIRVTASGIEKAKKILQHRGPDKVNYFKDDNVFLLHNRLAIIDLKEEADQPMIDKSTANTLVFNGEIYNHKELKKERQDINWETDSDSEVILKLYSVLGKEFVKKLNGIFSFAIYDKKRKKILLYRDRFGIKPLYYLKDAGDFVFSSEIKGILFFKEKGLSLSAIYDYLEYGILVYDKSTFFNDIFSLEPGHIMEYDIKTGGIKISRYWDIPNEDDASSIYRKDEEIVENTHRLLKESVRLNLVSDVEVAVSLSSGPDSVLLLNMVRQLNDKVKAFTYGFEEEEYDEIRALKNNLDLSGIKHYPVYFKKQDLLKTLEDAIYFFETPLGGLGTLSAYNMMKEVKKNRIKVILSGEGSDEVFGGYKYYYYAFFKDMEKKPGILQKELSYYSSKHGSDLKLLSEEYGDLFKKTSTTLVLAPDATGATISHTGRFLKQKYKKRELICRSRKFASKLKEMMYKDLTVKKLPKLLHFQDRASMSCGVETRVPYLDHNLVSYVYSLPPVYKIRDGESKYLLRKILKDNYSFGESRVTKHYVATPQREWLKDRDIQNRILGDIKKGRLVSNGFVDYKSFCDDYTAYSKSKELGNSFFVWKILNLEYLLNQKWK